MALGSRLRSMVGFVSRSVSAAVQRGISVFDFGRTLDTTAAAMGVDVSEITPEVLDTAFSIASSAKAATQAWRDAPGDAIVGPSMMYEARWSADLNTFNTDPRYWAHTELLVQAEDGTISSHWRYITGIRSVDMPKDQLAGRLRIQAQQFMAGTVENGGIEGALVGIGDVTLSIAPAGR